MNELVIMKDQQAVTTSLQVAETFGKRHKNVIQAIENKIQSAENSADYQNMFAKGTYKDSKGRTYPMYYMNRDGFTFVAFGFTGKKADEFKLEYIKAFNSMETQIRTGYTVPNSYAEALKLAAEQAEKIEQQQQTLAIQEPKVQLADAITASESTISISTLAKVIKGKGIALGRNRFFAWLRENDYLIKSGEDYNLPTQRSMNLGLFEVNERTYINKNGDNAISKSAKVTGKGQQYFINKLLKG